MEIAGTVALTRVTPILAAVCAPGTAALVLVDACKALPGGGRSCARFKSIQQTVLRHAPKAFSLVPTRLGQDSILQTRLSQRINGAATANQVNVVKSQSRLTPDTAPAPAQAAGVDGVILIEVARSINSYSRFDVRRTAWLDRADPRADQRDRNVAKSAGVPRGIARAVADSTLWKPAWSARFASTRSSLQG